MNFNYYFRFFCVFFISLLLDCTKEKCNQQEIANLKFTPGDRAIIPYSGNETLTFKNYFGDSIVFEKGSKKITSNVDYQYTRHEALAFNDCQGNYITYEQDELDFYSSVGYGYLQIILSNSCSFADPKSGKYIVFNFFLGDSVNLHFDAIFQFSNDTLFDYPNKNDSIVAYHYQITIGPKTYSDVYELYQNNINPEYNDWYKTAFYSTIDGLVGLRTNYGKLWYLAQKR
jgi:hypothetical protein